MKKTITLIVAAAIYSMSTVSFADQAIWNQNCGGDKDCQKKTQLCKNMYYVTYVPSEVIENKDIFSAEDMDILNSYIHPVFADDEVSIDNYCCDKGKSYKDIFQFYHDRLKKLNEHAKTKLQNHKLIGPFINAMLSESSDAITTTCLANCTAQQTAYELLHQISWQGVEFRTDIAYRAIEREQKA